MDEVFEELRSIMEPYIGELVVVEDEPGHLSLNTGDLMTNGKPRWFGGVRTMKNYVSFHLMPVYEDPSLLGGISPELKARMQGKSCFNFKRVDEDLFSQLDDLTRAGFIDFREKGKIG